MNGNKTEILLWIIAEMMWAYLYSQYVDSSIMATTLTQVRGRINGVSDLP